MITRLRRVGGGRENATTAAMQYVGVSRSCRLLRSGGTVVVEGFSLERRKGSEKLALSLSPVRSREHQPGAAGDVLPRASLGSSAYARARPRKGQTGFLTFSRSTEIGLRP